MRNPDERGIPGTGAAPHRQSAVNYNDRALDFVRAALGIPRTFAFGLDTPNVIMPVLVVDPDSPPLPQYKGFFAIGVAPSALNFSAAAIVNVGGAGGILKVWATVAKQAAGSVFIRINQGVAGTYLAAGGNGWTEQVTPSADSRLAGPAGTSGSGVALVAARNTIAASWAPPASVSLGSMQGIGAGQQAELGPAWLDQFDALTVEQSAINQEMDVIFRWEYFAPVR